MKKLLMILCLTSMISHSVIAQIPKEVIPLVNSLSRLWYNGEIEEAIETSLELYRLYPPMLIEKIHNSLSQQVNAQEKNGKSSVFLEQLHRENNEEINEIIKPIYLWSKVKNTVKSDSLITIIEDLRSVLTDSSNQKTQAEKYCLLVLKELDSKQFADQSIKKELLLKVISNLESFPYIKQKVNDRRVKEERARNRHLLAYSYYYFYLNFEKKEEHFSLASEYSPDQSDQSVVPSYFYDAALLTGNTEQFGYKMEYYEYLKTNNKTQKALNLLTEIAFCEPSDGNILELRSCYKVVEANESFEDYWLKFIYSSTQTVPQVKIDYPDEVLDLSKKPGSWIYIDVWGTWCSPCIAELPDLQEFFVENSQNTDSNLKIFTFSFRSQNLLSFMTANEYTFPVAEVDDQIVDAFHVSGYPTKILITPEGNYLKIPFGTDWVMYIKNYLLL